MLGIPVIATRLCHQRIELVREPLCRVLTGEHRSEAVKVSVIGFVDERQQHQADLRTSIWPVTAGAINAERRARASSMNRSVSAIRVSILAVCGSR